jgi:hypothetical protein
MVDRNEDGDGYVDENAARVAEDQYTSGQTHVSNGQTHVRDVEERVDVVESGGGGTAQVTEICVPMSNRAYLHIFMHTYIQGLER